jgi:hypothetical protein
MLNNIKSIKSVFFLFIITGMAVISTQSCAKEESSSLKCTIYLNGNVWSEKTVSDCSICTAPQGYTTTCN